MTVRKPTKKPTGEPSLALLKERVLRQEAEMQKLRDLLFQLVKTHGRIRIPANTVIEQADTVDVRVASDGSTILEWKGA